MYSVNGQVRSCHHRSWSQEGVLTDAMVGYVNPAKELLREAQDLFGEDAEVAGIVSTGAGKGNFRVVFKDGLEEGISGHSLPQALA